MIDIEQTLQKLTPVPADEYRDYVLTKEIFPMIENWGFERELQKELKLDSKQAAILKEMERRMTSGNGAIVALVGERGLGKSSLAAQFALKTAWKNHDAGKTGSGTREHVIYRKCARVVARYKPLFADYGTVETDSLLQSLDTLCRTQEYLVIDEVHECDDMKFKRSVLTDLIDRRYACKRPTILIANQTPEDFAATIGDSILSRLNQYGAILPCKWSTYRKQ